MPADGAIVESRIRTLDPERPFAQAIAWKDGVITEDLDIGPHTRVFTNLDVVPGLTDSHIHPFWGTELTRGVDLRDATALDEVKARLAAERHRCAPHEWVLAHSAHYEAFEGGLSADTIADAVGETPAIIQFFDGHSALASRPALALAGVTGAREFGESAEVVVDRDGTPTGMLLENGAMDLVRDVVPAWSEAQRLDAYARTLRALNAVGLTGAHVMVGDASRLADARKLEERGELTLRMVIPMHQDPAISDQEVDERLALVGEHGRLWRAGTAKFFLDGVLESGTAWLLEPGPGGVNGQPFWPSVQRYAELVRRFTQAGFSAITHAVGDGAVNAALNAYAAAGGPRRGMHRIEHIETLVDADLPRFAELGVAASMQPLHMEGVDEPGSAWAAGLSPGRYERGFRSADLARTTTLALGSDWMVADFDPRVGMAWARLRRPPGRPDHPPFHPEQALSAERTLAGYTTEAARVVGDATGVLAPGRPADITVFAADIVATPADELPGVPVLLTVVDGQVVHAA